MLPQPSSQKINFLQQKEVTIMRKFMIFTLVVVVGFCFIGYAFADDKALESEVYYDKNTGLEWYAGPDQDTTWNEAKEWVEKLSVAGDGWRMPTINELKSLYQNGVGTRNMTPLLKTTGWLVWSGETKDSSSAWGFNFYKGHEDWNNRNFFDYRRGFAVRSRK
jgi:hypothetical protein